MKRISCPGFAIIRDDQGRYGLMSDMETDGGGLLPIGGALHADAKGTFELIHRFGAPAEDFENGAALRFIVPENNVARVGAWFASRTDRDLTINRVLRYSLFHETGILTSDETKQGQFKQRWAGYDSGTGLTFRNVAERNTVYLIELYTVVFPEQTYAKLRLQAAARSSRFRFATASEIRSSRLADGTPISSIAVSLLNPSDQLRTS